MFPFMPLLLGFITGAAAVKLAQKSNGRRYVKQAGDKIRSATVSGLETLESTSSRLRQKLHTEEQPQPETPQADPVAQEVRDDNANI